MRVFRLVLVSIASLSVIYAVFVRPAPWSLLGFFLFGGLWLWLGHRKMRELDAPQPK